MLKAIKEFFLGVYELDKQNVQKMWVKARTNWKENKYPGKYVLPIFICFIVGAESYYSILRYLNMRTVSKVIEASLPSRATLLSYEKPHNRKSKSVYQLPQELSPIEVLQSYCIYFYNKPDWHESVEEYASKCNKVLRHSKEQLSLTFCMSHETRLDINIDLNSAKQDDDYRLIIDYNANPGSPAPRRGCRYLRPKRAPNAG